MIDVPSQHPERPRYKQVADELRRRINAGAIPPGALLPSESVLIQEFAPIARGTLRQAIEQLRNEGLVVTEHGRGTYVRPVLPIRRLGSERYRRDLEQIAGTAPLGTSFTFDQGIDWADYQLDRRFAEVPASKAIAELFEVEPGTMLLERHFTFRAHGIPQQMSVSWLLLDMVAGTPVADPDNEPWPGGNLAQFWSLGVRVTHIIERERSRMPLADEAETLHIPAGVPVATTVRRMFAGERVVEVADIVAPADRVEKEYRIDLTDVDLTPPPS